MASMISGLIMLSIGVIVLASVFVSTVKNTCTSGWSTGEVALWGTLTIAGIAGLVIGTLSVFGVA